MLAVVPHGDNGYCRGFFPDAVSQMRAGRLERSRFPTGKQSEWQHHAYNQRDI